MVTYCTIAVFRELLFGVSSPRTDKADCGWLNPTSLPLKLRSSLPMNLSDKTLPLNGRAVINYLKPSWIGTRRGENTYYGTLLCTSTSQAWSPL